MSDVKEDASQRPTSQHEAPSVSSDPGSLRPFVPRALFDQNVENCLGEGGGVLLGGKLPWAGPDEGRALGDACQHGR
eukprot:1396318-Lingulodinium_polyedra.AAC.1